MIRILLIFALLPSLGFSQLKSYDVEALSALQESNPKPVVIFLYADWCRYCKAMENTTLKKRDIIEKLNRDFYFVKFNGEQQEDVKIDGRTYTFKPSGNGTGIHELAQVLATINGQVNYPSVVVVNDKLEILYQYGGYMKANEFDKLLDVVVEKGL